MSEELSRLYHYNLFNSQERNPIQLAKDDAWSIKKMEMTSTGQTMSVETDASCDEVDVKRRRVMKCLQEIKSIVGTEKVQDDNSALSTLQAVVDQIKQLKEVGADNSHNKEHGDYSKEAYNPVELLDVDVGFCEEEDPNAVKEVYRGKGDYKISVCCSTRLIKDVSEDLISYLNFGKDELTGQPFNRFIHEKDILTFASSVSSLGLGQKKNGELDEETEKTVSFYMRLFHNNSTSWYTKDARRVRSSAFFSKVHMEYEKNSTQVPCLQSNETNDCMEITPSIQNLANSVHQAFRSSAQASLGDKKDSSLSYVMDCSPLQSAYKIRDRLPKQPCFSYKHSPGGLFTYIESSAIPMLGYLPQDLIGTSIFQFYHPEDYSVLLSAYQSLRMKPTKTTRPSQPVRFRVRNGEYIIVDTELSSFVNPWSKKLDLVIGKHSIVRGPQNMDVFDEYGSHSMLVPSHSECLPEHREILREILSTLSRPLTEESDKPKNTGKSDGSSSQPADEAQSSPNTDSSLNNKGSKNTDESHEADSSNLYTTNSSSTFSQWDQQEINKVYSSLAYLQGIQRLLASQYGPGDSGMRMQIPATGTLQLNKDMTWISNSADLETGSEDGTGFPHPPSQPASSTKAMLLEDDMQIMSPREPDREASGHGDENQRTVANMDTSETLAEPHVQKLTVENLQKHQETQRNKYLQSLLKDSDMRLFYETLSVPKLIRNLRHRLSKRRKLIESPHSPEVAYKHMRYRAEGDEIPRPNDFPVTCIVSIGAGAQGGVHSDQSARPQSQVGISLLHAHHPMHVRAPPPTTAHMPPPLLASAPPYGYAPSLLRYGMNKTSPLNRLHIPLIQPAHFTNTSLTPADPAPDTLNSWMAAQPGPACPPEHVPPAQPGPRATDSLSDKIGDSVGLMGRLTAGSDEAASCSSVGHLDSSLTDAASVSQTEERRGRCPFWLEDLHPNLANEQMFNYEVDLTHKEDLDNFCSKFCTKPQAPEIYQQLLEFELGKLDLDQEEDSDNSSLFTPVKATQVEQAWSKMPAPITQRLVTQDLYTDTDSSGFVSASLLNSKKQKPRSSQRRARAQASATANTQASADTGLGSANSAPPKESSAKASSKKSKKQQARQNRRNSKEVGSVENQMVDVLVEKASHDKNEGDSVEGMELHSNTSNNDSDNSGVKSDSMKSDSSKDISSKNSSSVGYQGSAEMTSSNGDVYSIDECNEYLDSNRKFCKTYNKEMLMQYSVKLDDGDDPLSSHYPSLHYEQPRLIVEQLDELVDECFLGEVEPGREAALCYAAALGGAGESDSSEGAPATDDVCVQAQAEAERTRVNMASAMETAQFTKSESVSQGDSGFQSGSTYDTNLFKGRNTDSQCGSSVFMSSADGKTSGSGSSHQSSGTGSSGNNGSSQSSGGNSSGASNANSGGSGSETGGSGVKMSGLGDDIGTDTFMGSHSEEQYMCSYPKLDTHVQHLDKAECNQNKCKSQKNKKYKSVDFKLSRSKAQSPCSNASSADCGRGPSSSMAQEQAGVDHNMQLIGELMNSSGSDASMDETTGQPQLDLIDLLFKNSPPEGEDPSFPTL